jgi:DNA-binding NarL/FixJ family response regulator
MTSHHSPPLPLPPELWEEIAIKLKLSPMHKRIVEKILQNRCDKQIVTDIRIGHSTLRTHITRIFHRLKVQDRLELVLLVFAMSHSRGHHS